MAETTNINVHLHDDTKITCRLSDAYVAIGIGENLYLYLDSHTQLAELIQACDQASKVLY